MDLVKTMIRPARESDFATIGRIFHDAVRQIAGSDYTEAQLCAWSPRELGAVHWSRRTAELEVRVAEIDSAIVGFIGFSPVGHIDLLFVRPDFVRRGIGRTLVLEAEEFLRQSGVGMAWTEASLTAHGFFHAAGYREVRQQNVCCGGVDLRNYRMEKLLIQPDGPANGSQPSPQ